MLLAYISVIADKLEKYPFSKLIINYLNNDAFNLTYYYSALIIDIYFLSLTISSFNYFSLDINFIFRSLFYCF